MFSGNLVIKAGNVNVHGILTVPAGSNSLVIFSHDNGSNRFSPRNKFVASVLNNSGISTFLVDLLSTEEDTMETSRFDIGLVTSRLVYVTEYFNNEKPLRFKRQGYFGASAGAASVLAAASKLSKRVDAIVLRGGRPDLASIILPNVKSPTLFIVPELDQHDVDLNEKAFSLMRCDKSIRFIPHASHTFEEPGALEKVAKASCEWFTDHF